MAAGWIERLWNGDITGFSHPFLSVHWISNIWSVKVAPKVSSDTGGFGFSCEGEQNLISTSEAWKNLNKVFLQALIF